MWQLGKYILLSVAHYYDHMQKVIKIYTIDVKTKTAVENTIYTNVGNKYDKAIKDSLYDWIIRLIKAKKADYVLVSKKRIMNIDKPGPSA